MVLVCIGVGFPFLGWWRLQF